MNLYDRLTDDALEMLESSSEFSRNVNQQAAREIRHLRSRVSEPTAAQPSKDVTGLERLALAELLKRLRIGSASASRGNCHWVSVTLTDTKACEEVLKSQLAAEQPVEEVIEELKHEKLFFGLVGRAAKLREPSPESTGPEQPESGVNESETSVPSGNSSVPVPGPSPSDPHVVVSTEVEDEAGLELRYFVLKPKAKHHDDMYARASQRAMQAYAEHLQDQGANGTFARDLSGWSTREMIRQERLEEPTNALTSVSEGPTDAERLDWLEQRNYADFGPIRTTSGAGFSVLSEGQYYAGENLRGAIDAAIQAATAAEEKTDAAG